MHAIDGMACAKRGCDNRGKLSLNIVGHGSFPTKWGRRWRYCCTVCGGTVSTHTGTAYSGLRCARRAFDVGVSERLFGSACVYGQVLKTRRNDRVVRVERRRRIGTAGRLKAALWESEDSETLNTSFVERLNLTIRQGSAYLRRRSPCPARGADQLHGHVDLLRCSYNVIRPHRALKFGRETRTPAMQAGLVNAPMNWSDIFTAPAALYAFHVAVVRVPGAVQLMHTSPAALSSFSWPHEHRSAA